MNQGTIVRTYQRTHPWISFELDLGRMPSSVWLMLGEINALCEILGVIPTQPDIREEFYSCYLAKGAHATTAIEGNTLSEEQVRQRMEGKVDLPPSREYQGIEVDNILSAFKEIETKILFGAAEPISVEEVKGFNKKILQGLELPEEVTAGLIRAHNVGVFQYRGAPPEDCEFLLNKMCGWLNDENLKPRESLTAFGVIRAVLAHLYVEWIHPFGDGNGRTGRLLEFRILLEHNVPSACAHLLSNHYNNTRTEYYRQLDRASKSGGDIFPFLKYAAEGLRDGLREQFAYLIPFQLREVWINYTYNLFREKTGAANRRRKKLILDFPPTNEPLAFKKIRSLSTDVAEIYANITDRVLRRDINELVKMGLLTKVEQGFSLNFDILAGFIGVQKSKPTWLMQFKK